MKGDRRFAICQQENIFHDLRKVKLNREVSGRRDECLTSILIFSPSLKLRFSRAAEAYDEDGKMLGRWAFEWNFVKRASIYSARIIIY